MLFFSFSLFAGDGSSKWFCRSIYRSLYSCFFWKIHLIRNINEFLYECNIFLYILNNPGYHQETSFKKYQCTEFLAVHIWDALQFGCNLCPGLRCCHEQVSAEFSTSASFMSPVTVHDIDHSI